VVPPSAAAFAGGTPGATERLMVSGFAWFHEYASKCEAEVLKFGF
jgi:hypothetical protein